MHSTYLQELIYSLRWYYYAHALRVAPRSRHAKINTVGRVHEFDDAINFTHSSTVVLRPQRKYPKSPHNLRRTCPGEDIYPLPPKASNPKSRSNQITRFQTSPCHAALSYSYIPPKPIPPGPWPPPAPFACASACRISETFIWTSKNFAAHLSMQTPSPLFSSPSR